jgi:surface antigen
MRGLNIHKPRAPKVKDFISADDPGSLLTLSALPTPPKLSKRSRRRLIRWGIVAGNLILLIAVGVFVLTNRSASQTVRISTVSGAIATTSLQANPLDQLSSAQIALAAAQMTKMPEVAAVRSQADSEVALLSVVPNDTTILAKPQIVSTAQKSKNNIIHYVAVTGDTLSGLATKFGISSNSIRWSNSSITGENISAGVNLLIPPADGIVYQVKAGDTADTVASKYRVDKGLLVTVNDAESGLPVGQSIWIPGGVVQPVATYTTADYSYGGSYGVGWSGPSYAGNTYDYGWCTWYAYNRRAELGRPVPSNLGNAYTWYIIAKNMGVPTGLVPQDGAVAQSGDHVTVVEQVNPDGSFWISEMNASGQVSMTDTARAGGWGRVDWKLIPASAAGSYRYIY